MSFQPESVHNPPMDKFHYNGTPESYIQTESQLTLQWKYDQNQLVMIFFSSGLIKTTPGELWDYFSTGSVH